MNEFKDGGAHRETVADAALVAPLEHNIRRLLIQTDSKSFQLFLENNKDSFTHLRRRLTDLNDLLVSEGTQSIEHNEDQIARARHGDDLPATTLAVLGTFDNSWKIEELDFCALNDSHSQKKYLIASSVIDERAENLHLVNNKLILKVPCSG